MVDIDSRRVDLLRAGDVPFFEPGLEVLMGVARERLEATLDPSAVADCSVVFLAVPTPSAADGSCDVSILESAARAVAPHLAAGSVLVVKSTVPVGTTQRVRDIVCAARGADDVLFAMNPEFLREGSAVGDFQVPHRVVVGIEDDAARPVMTAVYASFVDDERPLIFTDLRSAELCKYAANAYLAMRIAWINEIAALAERVDADIDMIRRIIGTDPRIGPQYLKPGPGYGGTCFPKDVQALGFLSRESGLPLRLVDATHAANLAHRERIVERIVACLPARGGRVALWGLAFKANSDDVRESISLQVLDQLARHDVVVSVWDPQVRPEHLGDRVGVVDRFADSPLDAARGADLVVVLTEWAELRTLAYDEVAAVMRGDTLFDTRNLLDPGAARGGGLKYLALGRR